MEELNNSEYAKKGLLRHNPEDNIPKGCGKMIEEADRLCGMKYGYYKDEKREYIKKKTDYDIWLCANCSKKGCGKSFSRGAYTGICGRSTLKGNIELCPDCRKDKHE